MNVEKCKQIHIISDNFDLDVAWNYRSFLWNKEDFGDEILANIKSKLRTNFLYAALSLILALLAGLILYHCDKTYSILS